MSLDDLLASDDPKNWSTVFDLLRSEQIPPQRIAEIFHDFPKFTAWVQAEALQ